MIRDAIVEVGARRATYVVGLLLVALIFSLGGSTSAGVLVAAIPMMAVLAILSVFYMNRIYARLERPRPAFFRMLLGAQTIKVSAAVIGGYLAVAYILRDAFGIRLPLPPQGGGTALLAFLVLILLSPPLYYAATIYILRRGHPEEVADER